MALTDEQKREFDENGYVIVRGLLSREEVDAIGGHADQIAVGEIAQPASAVQVEPAIQRKEEAAKSKLEAVRKLSSVARTDPIMHAHATNPKILDILEGLIGPDIKLFDDQLFMKSPAHGSRKNYHQDSNSSMMSKYVPHSLVSCWAALDDATVDNGCLWFIPGSHKWGRIPVEREREIEKQALAGALENEVPIELKAGDCSFHHSLLMHCSRANRSSARRRGYATQYMSAKSKFTGEGTPYRTDFLLLRGEEFPGCV
jgi:phytanoyl-CoA hydroxylase